MPVGGGLRPAGCCHARFSRWKTAEGRSGSAKLNNEIGKIYDQMAGVEKIINDISSG